MIHPEQQRRAYLQAMGVDVWLPRDAESPASATEAEFAPQSAGAESMNWDELRQCVATCTRCELSATRTKTVFGAGNPDADWLIVGGAPGADEDRSGEPFVDRSGSILAEMLRAIGQSRESVFIANILKCRPPNNRNPKPDEASACRSYLDRQIELVKPKVVLATGEIAAQNLLGSTDTMERMRGGPHSINGLPLVVTYHPAYLLHSPSHKRDAWQDLCLAVKLAAESQAA